VIELTREELKALRGEANITQEEAARILKVSIGTLRSWESKTGNPIKPVVAAGIKKAIGDYIKTGEALC
jgi:DNA-binding transcriptional regulator YiaG